MALIRGDKLILALGAIAGCFLGSETEVSEDPRLRDFRWFSTLVERPPGGFQVTVRIKNQAFDLLEGQEIIVDSYYIFVEQAYRVGIPGQQSILSIAQLDENQTKETILNCIRRFTNPDKMTTRWER